MDCCPVSCIHWVDKADLPALEYVMRNRTSRPNVAVMMSGQGGAVQDVWDSTAKYLKERAARWVWLVWVCRLSSLFRLRLYRHATP